MNSLYLNTFNPYSAKGVVFKTNNFDGSELSANCHVNGSFNKLIYNLNVDFS